MCDSIRFNNGNEVQTVREFQEHFQVDATLYGFDDDDTFLDCCMCAIDLTRFFADHPEHQFYHENGDWWEGELPY